MIINRVWAMPSKHTFTIKPIKELLQKYVGEKQLAAFLSSPTVIIDPFAGENSIGTLTNDMNPHIKADYHLDALEFLKLQKDSSADIILYDPPYSYRQVKECYNSIGIEKFDPRQTRMDYWSDIKTELSRILKIGGLAICCGWNSAGLGKKNRCKIIEVLLVPHGGNRNDTIITVERKC